MTAPLLHPPCPGWQRDLAAPGEPPAEAPDIVFGAPSHLDEVYLEIFRRSFGLRGLHLLFGVLSIVIGLYTTTLGAMTVVERVVRKGGLDMDAFFGAVMVVGSFAAFSVCACLSIRLDLSLPRSEPLRFNRLRRKVYIYGAHFVWWNPFTRWYVAPKAYAWDDIRAEVWKQRGAMASGLLVLNEGVSLAVVKPGTNEVIDRFQLSGAVQTALWAYICTYMQQGPQALKPCESPMREANDTLNPITRLAPKVQWPEAMDIESRTGP